MALKLRFKYVVFDIAVVLGGKPVFMDGVIVKMCGVQKKIPLFFINGMSEELVKCFGVGCVILVLRLFGQPNERGFFCSDTSISYPCKEDTVSDLALGIGALFVPVCVVTLSELVSCGLNSTSSLSWRDKSLPLFVVRTYTHAMHFLVGAGISEMIVDVAKYYVGRLRPHFLDVCKPPPSVCVNAGREFISTGFPHYVTEFNCTGDSKEVREARLSFPSGHAMLSFYAAVYLVCYLHSRLRWPFSDVFRLVVQGVIMAVAWWTTLSRITDNAHHPEDVIAGALIGTITALLVVYLGNEVLKKSKCSSGEQTSIHPSINPEKIQAPTPCA